MKHPSLFRFFTTVKSVTNVTSNAQEDIPVDVRALWFPLNDSYLRLRVSVTETGILIDIMRGCEAVGRLALPDEVLQKISNHVQTVRLEQDVNGVLAAALDMLDENPYPNGT